MIWWLVLGFLTISPATKSLAEDTTSIDFTRDIRPILSEHCFHCHGPDQATREADLRLDQPDALSDILPDLRERILSADPELRMPPPEARKPLSEQQQHLIQRWLDQGAEVRGHWAFRPAQRPPLPPEMRDPWCANPIDAFVLAELRRRHLIPADSAPPTTLVRRLSLDLVGLPPEPEAIAQFCETAEQDGLARASEQWMERCFQSPEYAEHMTLPWLEAARYADTDGYQNDRYRYQHAWRDWVLKAFNEKMPYDQFLIEQLAGDLLPEATLWQQVATGFGRNHRINSEDGSIPEEWRTENVVDRVDTFGTVFLGMTVGCARCHDHKYDPISQTEYYQLFAYFNSIAETGVGPNNGNSPPFVTLPESWPLLSDDEDRALIPDPVRLRAARKDSGNGLRRPQAGEPGTVMVMHELSEPRPTYLLVRGQYNQPDTSQQLQPNVPVAWNAGQTDRPAPRTRLDLARWCVDSKNPLTARVAVNRIWQQIMGVGLVVQSENFGSQGDLPTHPRLLDWLAVELIDSGWNIQRIQRLILSSATYQQSSRQSPEALENDPSNQWLARAPRRRLSAFALRDQALALSGLMVHRTGGPSAKPYMPEKIWSAISNNKYQTDQGGNLFRRSLYTYWRRTIPPPSMVNFNAAAREVCTVRTELTNTPLQALTLLNNKTFVEASRCLAGRILSSGASELDEQISFGFQLITARKPEPAELQTLHSAYDRFYAEFETSPDSAQQLLDVGQAPRDKKLEPTGHAAMTLATGMMLNLDEAITKE